MDRFDDDTLLAELKEIRPTPRPEFTAELDERVAAGFARRDGASANPFAELAARRRAMTPRRRLIPVLATAFAVLVAATVVVGLSQSDLGSPRVSNESMTSAESSSGGEFEGAEGGSEEDAAGGGEAAEATIAPATPRQAQEESEESAPSEEVFGTEVPSVAGAAGAEAAPAEKAAPKAVAPGHRDIERSAYITLGTKPGEVSSAAAKVFEAVHAVNGVVLHSKVQSGSAGATGAYFDLLIPSAKLDDALSSFSQVAEVRERHDATNDITAPTVGAAEELRDSIAAIEGLLKELGDAETEAERESVEARLREERGRHAAIRARLDNLDRRASMSEVTVRIVTDHGAGVTPAGKGGSWGVGDALHDAGHILTIAAGVALIGLAILAPIALIALALWLANRFRVRRLRERTLG
ncbi:MAG: DUF4349 domain-containing protein [Actinobacteria bacterium]|nr:DUF4349 domain-containing protein [Actinomycetota bacterium]